jgi:hypothetical protein
MKRLLQSVLGGVLIPPALLSPLLLLENCCLSALERLDKIPWLVSLGRLYLSLLMFPFLILAPFEPKSDSPDPNAPFMREAILISAILIDFIAYSLLTYLVLTWRDRRKARKHRGAAQQIVGPERG